MSNPNPSTDLPSPKPLTEEQRKLIKATVPVLEEHGETITRLFYKQMLEENPELRNVFNHTKQQRGDQQGALARAVYAYAANIDDLTPVLPTVERLCNKHASLHILPSQYAIVGKYLLGAITQVVGKEVFSGDLYEAWVVAYWQLAHICINREAELYKAAGWIGWKDFVVSKRVNETPDITSFYLSPKDGKPLPAFRPGQYISVQRYIKELGFLQSRQYSLSDSPDAGDHFRISVKRERGVSRDAKDSWQPGWMSNLLHDTLQQGDSVEVAYPFGDFFLDDTDAAVVLISAGVGLTPLTSMLHAALERKNPRPVSWVQVVHSAQAHALNAEVRRLLGTQPTLVRKAVFYSEPGTAAAGKDFDLAGRMNLGKVDPATLRLDEPAAQYYVCGPERFMADMIKSLKEKGVDPARIHAEVFGAGAAPI